MSFATLHDLVKQKIYFAISFLIGVKNDGDLTGSRNYFASPLTAQKLQSSPERGSAGKTVTERIRALIESLTQTQHNIFLPKL